MAGVYYREVGASDNAQEFYVLDGNTVTVSENLTKSELQQITTNPTLTFTAYAVQQEGVGIQEAWNIAQGEATP